MPERELTAGGRIIKYKIRKSKKARRVRLAVYCDGSLTLTVPRFSSEFLAQKFLESKISWIIKKLEYFSSKKITTIPKWQLKGSRRDYGKQKINALALARERIYYFNQFYNFKYQKISIRNQKTRWGSCSKNGNLSFNYKIIYLPPNFADYIIVHELCHLGQFNHSGAFWKLVSRTIPGYKEIRKNIRQ